MGNEMGNSNSNDLQASDGVEATTDVAESEASIVANAVYGQKSVADNAALERRDMNDVTKDRSSKDSIVSNSTVDAETLIAKNDADGVQGASQASASEGSENLHKNQNQSSQNDNLQTSETNRSVEGTIQVSASVESEDLLEKQQSTNDGHSPTDGNLVQEQTSKIRDDIEGLIQTNASVESEDLSQKQSSHDNHSETDDKQIQKQTSTRIDDVEGASQASAPGGYKDLPEQSAHDIHSVSDDNLIQEQTFERTHGFGSASQASGSMESEDLSEQQSSYDDHTAEDGDNLVQKQASGRRGEGDEMATSTLNSSSEIEPTRIVHYDCSAEGTRDQQISKVEEGLASDGEDEESEDIKLEKPNESMIPHPTSNSENLLQDFAMEENGLYEEEVLMNHGVVDETKENTEKQHCGSHNIVGDSTHEVHTVSSDRVNLNYLEAIDFEIERLIIEDDQKSLDKACNAETSKISDTVKVEDVETETFEIKLEIFECSEKEKQKQESECIFEDSYLEQATETREVNETESKYGKKEDHDPSLVSEMCKKDSKGNSGVEVRNGTLLTEYFGSDETFEEKKEYGKDLQNEKEGKDNAETLPRLSTSSPDPVGSVTKGIQVELEDINAIGTSATEEAESSSGKLDEQFQRVPSITIAEAHLSQEGSKQIQTTASRQPDPCELNKDLIQQHQLSLEAFKEFEQKHMETKPETLTDKEEQITSLDQKVSSLTNVTECSKPGLPSIPENTFTLIFELESKKNVQDESHGTRDGLLVDSGKQSQKEEKLIPRDHSNSLTTLEALEGNGRFSTKFNQENLCVGSKRTSMGDFSLEQLSVAPEDSAPQEEKDNCKENSLLYPTESVKHLIYKSESGHGAQENSASNILAVQIETKQNSSLVSETSLSTVESNHEDYDMSSIVNQKKTRESELSALEASNAGKLRSPLVGLLKEETYAAGSSETQKGPTLKESIEDIWKPPVNKIMKAPLRGKAKQKPRSSVFGSCMCCTTAIN